MPNLLSSTVAKGDPFRARLGFACQPLVEIAGERELPPSPFGLEVLVGHELVAELPGEHLGAVADQHDVRGALEHVARQGDGIADVLEPGDRARVERAPIHDRGIELADALGVHDRAVAGVEERRVLHDLDRGDDRVEAGAAALEDAVADGQRFAEFLAILGLEGGRQLLAKNDAGPAVDDEAEGGIRHGDRFGGNRPARKHARDGPPGVLASPELQQSEGGRSLTDRNPIFYQPCPELAKVHT